MTITQMAGHGRPESPSCQVRTHMLTAIWALFVRATERRRQQRESMAVLNHASDHVLADIGLRRDHIVSSAADHELPRYCSRGQIHIWRRWR